MQNQPEQKGLSTSKSVALGIGIAAPIALGTFFYGFYSGKPAPTAPVNLALNRPANQNANQPQAEQTAVVDQKIKGNKNSKIYHWRGCPNYNDISETNIVWFKTRDEAKTAGYRPARNCP